jgi:hypothetical protein
MACITSTLATGVTGAFGGPPVRVRFPSSLSGSAAATVRSYFTADGVFGSTTDPAAVPSTAGIVRTVTQ